MHALRVAMTLAKITERFQISLEILYGFQKKTPKIPSQNAEIIQRLRLKIPMFQLNLRLNPGKIPGLKSSWDSWCDE